jgi:membrane protease YdiL (CAAX protease family)
MTKTKKLTFIMLLLVAPFYLNDFAFIYLSGTYGVYLADYFTRILVLALCFLIPLSRKIVTEESTYIWKPGLAISFVILLPILGRTIHHLVEVPVFNMTGSMGLFQFILISDPLLYWLDLTAGLVLVAISEELIFRKFMLKYLESFKLSYWKILIFSSAIFSLMHWSNGLGRLLYCFVGGIIYMAAYYKIKRIWPLILAHWFEDFIAFGGLDL